VLFCDQLGLVLPEDMAMVKGEEACLRIGSVQLVALDLESIYIEELALALGSQQPHSQTSRTSLQLRRHVLSNISQPENKNPLRFIGYFAIRWDSKTE